MRIKKTQGKKAAAQPVRRPLTRVAEYHLIAAFADVSYKTAKHWRNGTIWREGAEMRDSVRTRCERAWAQIERLRDLGEV